MKKTLLFLFFVGTISALSAQKVGYVNSQQIIAEMPEVKVANSDIEALKSQLLKKGQEMVKNLQAKYQKLEQARNEMAPVKFEEELTKLAKEEEEIKVFEEQSQLKIYQKTEELLGPVQKKINDAIQAVAKENGYSYIFDEVNSNIVYADEKANISDLVKNKLKQ